MIDGLTTKKDSVMDKALSSISESEKKILSSVIKNDAYYLKKSGNLRPTPAKVAQLPDTSSQGFLLIYNQLQELLGEKETQGATTQGSGTSGLGKVFESLGIGMQAMGQGFEMLGMGLAAMGNPAVFAGIGAASLILLAISGFIAGLAAMENAGVGPSVLITTLLKGLADSLIYLLDGLGKVLSDNSELIETLLGKFIEALEQLPPIMHELGPIIDAIMPRIIQGLESFENIIVSLIKNLDEIIDSFGDFVVKVIEGAFNAVTTAVERLANVDGKNLFVVAGGMAAISAAMVAFGVGSVVAGLGSFLGGDGIVTKLQDLADLGPNLSSAGAGIKDLASGVKALGAISISSKFFLRDSEIENIISFVNAFNDDEFKKSLNGLKDTLPLFESFSNSLSAMAAGILSLSSLDDSKYNKALKRVKEFVSLSKEAGSSLSSITETFANAPISEVNDAVFTLDDSSNTGTYFQTKDGMVKTNPMDNLTVVASTNTPDSGMKEMTEALSSKFDELLGKLDNYVEAITNKAPDITVLPSEGGGRMQIDELLRVGV